MAMGVIYALPHWLFSCTIYEYASSKKRVSPVFSVYSFPRCNTLLLACHSRLAQTSDKQVDKPVETCVQVDWHSKAAHHFQRDKTMNNAAQATNGVNSIFLAESVWRKHGPDNIHKLLRESLHLLTSWIGCLHREGIASGYFPGISPVGIGERENGLCT